MTSCVSCGADVTGKKFCPHCGTRVQATGAPVSNQSVPVNACPRCNGEVAPGAAFCVHCGAALGAASAMRMCPACQAEVPSSSAFCTNCGHDMRGVSVSQPAQAPAFCTSCGQQNAPGVRFCGHCGSPMGVGAAQTASMQSGQYPPPPPPPYQQYPQQYGQPQYGQQYGQAGGYQAQPMMGQGPMVLRCRRVWRWRLWERRAASVATRVSRALYRPRPICLLRVSRVARVDFCRVAEASWLWARWAVRLP